VDVVRLPRNRERLDPAIEAFVTGRIPHSRHQHGLAVAPRAVK
jgi:hypothetical protein